MKAGVPLPREREHPLEPPAAYDRLRASGPVVRLRLADDESGWLVLGHAEARSVLSDPRFSARRTPGPVAVRQVDAQLVRRRARLGALPRMDPPEHTRYRRLLGRHFSQRRIAALVPRIERIAAEHLDAMLAAGSPADLVTGFAAPVATQVICEILGVPYEDRHMFWARTAGLLAVDTPHDRLLEHLGDALDFMSHIVTTKRQDPSDDLLSVLVKPATGLTDDELAGLGNLLLTTGHEEPASMIALAVVALLAHPDQLDRLRQNRGLVDPAIEELLRHQTILHFGVARTAIEPIELGGQAIHPGETAVVALPAVNRDPAVYACPHALDITRARSAHLGFGHGIHQCLGQHLARAQLRAVLTLLLDRVPTLELAAPVRRLRFRHDMFVYGVHEVPVAWS